MFIPHNFRVVTELTAYSDDEFKMKFYWATHVDVYK